ncbi:MAG: hypothetical protein ABUL60_31795 [Myxococcales bacterium]
MTSGAGQPGEKPSKEQLPVLLIVLGSVLGTLLVVGGGYWFFQRKVAAPAEESQKPSVPACEARREERGFQLSECYTKYAEATAAPELCEALPVGGEARYSRADCIKRVALATGNAALCERVGNDDGASCFRDLAVVLEDVKLCEKISRVDERERCYHDLARALQQPELCRRVERDRERASCLSGAIPRGTDPKVCDMLQLVAGRESCLSEVARDDPAVCLQLPEPRRAQCVSLSSRLRELDDPTAPCGGVADCLAVAARFDISLCERISPVEKTRRTSCVESVLSQAGGRWVHGSTCNQLQDLELRDVCFNRLGHAFDHESACQSVLNVAMRNECLESAKRRLAERL